MSAKVFRKAAASALSKFPGSKIRLVMAKNGNSKERDEIKTLTHARAKAENALLP